MGSDRKVMHDADRDKFVQEVQAVVGAWWPREGSNMQLELALELFAKFAQRGSLLEKDAAADGVWCAWLSWLQCRGKPPGAADAAMRWMHQLARRHQHPDGRMHDLDAQTNLDTFTYDELVTLHALGSMALATGDLTLLNAARKMAGYHMANTQPDHTTDEPWAMGVFAFFEETRMFAQQQLHNVRAGGNRSRSVFVLLRDAVVTMAQAGTIDL
jgi:hypothetical protein